MEKAMKNAQLINEGSVELDGSYSTITSHKKLLLFVVFYVLCFLLGKNPVI